MSTLVTQDINNDIRFCHGRGFYDDSIYAPPAAHDFVWDLVYGPPQFDVFVHDSPDRVSVTYDANFDVRFSATPGFGDIASDVRFKVIIEMFPDIRTDVRFFDEAEATRDVYTDVRTHLQVFGNIKSDVRFEVIISAGADINTDFRSLGVIYYDMVNDFRTKKVATPDVKNDVRMHLLTRNDVRTDIRFTKIYYKEIYSRCIDVQKECVQDFYTRADKVDQYAITIPTGIGSVDMLKGDLVKVTWAADGNYGYNVYRTDPGGRAKMNSDVITDEFYLVGNLTEDVAYTFIVVGVNGLGNESADSTSTIVTPTYPDFTGSATRFYNHVIQVKINTVIRADIKPVSVELGYGTSPAVARFKIDVDPVTAGLPTYDDDVEVIVNGTTIFKGIIKSKDEGISSSGKASSFIAYSKSVLLNNSSLSWSQVQSIKRLYDGLDVTDQTYLQSRESIWNHFGNYRMFYDMNNDTLSAYRLGTGTWNRTVNFGKNVIEWSIQGDELNKINKMTVIGAKTKTIRDWSDLTWRIKEPTIDERGYRWIEITGHNIADIQVQARASQGEPTYEFSDVGIVPSDVGLGQWEDGTKEVKPTLNSYTTPPRGWSTAGTEIEYSYRTVGGEKLPYKARIKLTSDPVVITPTIKTVNAVRKGRVASENVVFGTVSYPLEPRISSAPFRISYSTEESTPIQRTAGSGLPSRTVTDTSYKIVIDRLKGTTNASSINSQINVRAIGELAKVNNPIISGNIKILGDENFNLKTLVEIRGSLLDVVRVTHGFVSGFTTDIELTNEKFRPNIASYRRHRDQQDLKMNQKANENYISGPFTVNLKSSELTGDTQQHQNNPVPKTPFGLYGD